MKIVVAFSGFYERSKEESWRVAWPYFKSHFYDLNSKHEIITVFHTWNQPTEEMMQVLRPKAYRVTSQVTYGDEKIPQPPRKAPGYRGTFYNNFKNRLNSYVNCIELAKQFNPDVIFLTRFDVVIKFDIIIDNLGLSRDEIHTGNWLVPKHHFACDHYFLGHHEVLERTVMLANHYNEKMFEPGASYHDWIMARQEKGRLLKDQNWLEGHTIFPWFFHTNGIKWHNLGKQDSNTWLVRQCLKNGQAVVPGELEPYIDPNSVVSVDPMTPRPDLITAPETVPIIETVPSILPSPRACPHCGKTLPDTL
jgi:hypothetical protein